MFNLKKVICVLTISQSHILDSNLNSWNVIFLLKVNILPEFHSTYLSSSLHFQHRSMLLLSSRWSEEGMTSKLDNPPPYEDVLHHPKYENYPGQPQHGSPLPPPPSYSASPGTFPGVPGYPQAAMWAAAGFSPPGVPTTVPTLSAGVPASNTGSEEMPQRLDIALDIIKSHVWAHRILIGYCPTLQETWKIFWAPSGKAHLFAMPSSER